MLGASLPQSISGASLKVVTTYAGNDNTQNEYPRLAPARYSSACTAEFNAINGQLSILFNIDNPNIEIEIYKDGNLVSHVQQPVSVGEELSFDVSSYGTGYHEIFIMNAENEVIIGTFCY